MHNITLSGDIGYEITANYVKRALDEANGDDVFVSISSPGGSVFDGIEIFNMFRSYKGHVEMHINSLAASMASYIAMAGDKITAEDNAVFMIHNPWCFSVGDYKEMKKTAYLLEGLASLLASAYEKRTKKDKKEISLLMDETTWLFGEEIVSSGFADELTIAGDGATSKASAIIDAKTLFGLCQEKVRKDGKNDSYDKISAIIKGSYTPPVVEVEENNEGDIIMDINELKAKNPDLYNEVYQAGIKAESDRRSRLEEWFDMGEDAKAVAKEAIANGKTQDDVLARLLKAANTTKEAVEAQAENAPAVNVPEEKKGKGSTESEESPSDIVEDLKKRAKAHIN